MEYASIPIRTHLVSSKDDPVGLVRKYVGRLIEPDDVVVISESVIAITQGRAIPSEGVKPGFLARFLCRFPNKEGSLATPQAMHLAIKEVGAPRVILGAVVGGLGKAVGVRGLFYKVAGPQLALIDDIAGTIPPYDRCVVLGPKNPAKVARQIGEAIGTAVVIADVNDALCVDILGVYGNPDLESVKQALRTNPGGNDDQQTPIVLLRRAK